MLTSTKNSFNTTILPFSKSIYLTQYNHFASLSQSNYYDILEIEHNANAKQIKSAFYKKAKEHHPDVSNNDGSTFKELKRAYIILMNDDLKCKYDSLLRQGVTNFDNLEDIDIRSQSEFKDFDFSQGRGYYTQRGKVSEFRDHSYMRSMYQNGIFNQAKKQTEEEALLEMEKSTQTAKRFFLSSVFAISSIYFYLQTQLNE